MKKAPVKSKPKAVPAPRPPKKEPVTKAPAKAKTTLAETFLRQRISLLSEVLDEAGRRFLSRLRREIEETEDALLRQPAKKQDKAVRLIDALQVKPAKGRRKDLKKLDLLIGELQKLAEDK